MTTHREDFERVLGRALGAAYREGKNEARGNKSLGAENRRCKDAARAEILALIYDSKPVTPLGVTDEKHGEFVRAVIELEQDAALSGSTNAVRRAEILKLYDSKQESAPLSISDEDVERAAAIVLTNKITADLIRRVLTDYASRHAAPFTKEDVLEVARRAIQATRHADMWVRPYVPPEAEQVVLDFITDRATTQEGE